jgi:hypothetical protein
MVNCVGSTTFFWSCERRQRSHPFDTLPILHKLLLGNHQIVLQLSGGTAITFINRIIIRKQEPAGSIDFSRQPLGVRTAPAGAVSATYRRHPKPVILITTTFLHTDTSSAGSPICFYFCFAFYTF